MSQRYHLPDHVVAGLASGEVDRVDYTKPQHASVIFADGRVEDFDTEITPEIIERDYNEWLANAVLSGAKVTSFKIVVAMRRMELTRRITGWTN